MQTYSQGITGQNSRLFVGLSGGCLSCFLADADYDASTFFLEHFATRIPQNFLLKDLDPFFENLLVEWGKELDRKLVDCTPGVCMPATHGFGLNGATLVTSSEYYDTKFKSELLGVRPVIYDSGAQIEAVARATRDLEVSSLIYVQLNWDETAVFFATSKNHNTHVSEFRVNSKLPFVHEIPNFSSFAAVKLEKDELHDFSLNLFDERPIFSQSSKVWDFLRCYISANLISIQDKVFREFGLNDENAQLIITGDLCRLIPQEQVLLAVVDGLQLRGHYRISIDRDNIGMVALNSNPETFPFAINKIYPGGYIYISPEKGGTGKSGSRAFTGRIDSGEQQDASLMLGQTGQCPW